MYVTIKIENGGSTIQSIKVGNEEIFAQRRYNVLPHKFVHVGGENFTLEEAANRIIERKRK